MERLRTAVTRRQCFYCGRPVWWVTQGYNGVQWLHGEWETGLSHLKHQHRDGRHHLAKGDAVHDAHSCNAEQLRTLRWVHQQPEHSCWTYCLLTFFIFTFSLPTLTACPNTTCTHTSEKSFHVHIHWFCINATLHSVKNTWCCRRWLAVQPGNGDNFLFLFLFFFFFSFSL